MPWTYLAEVQAPGLLGRETGYGLTTASSAQMTPICAISAIILNSRRNVQNRGSRTAFGDSSRCSNSEFIAQAPRPLAGSRIITVRAGLVMLMVTSVIRPKYVPVNCYDKRHD